MVVGMDWCVHYLREGVGVVVKSEVKLEFP